MSIRTRGTAIWLGRDQGIGSTVPAKYREYASDINASGQASPHHRHDILDMATLEAGTLTFEIAPTDVSAMIDQVSRMNRSSRQWGRKVRVTTADGSSLRRSGQLQQAFLMSRTTRVNYANRAGS